jgi:Asp-tRNA(Asn)/Glu-tRNA(Gln) amidotransferase A subunit family amidase
MTDADRDLMLGQVNELLDGYRSLRRIELDNSELPALRFEVLGADSARTSGNLPQQLSVAAGTPPTKPIDQDDLAFATIAELGAWMRGGHVTASQLAQLSLHRLQSTDGELACVIQRTEDRALDAARSADADFADGKDRGPLHGVPWGAKDLLAVPGYRTTWGAEPFKDQVRKETATVVKRLDAAGASLVAKLTLGALAWGDVWYGGTTKNPWDTEQGSSGSSAGPAAAVAAGLVPFSIGSETWGSIVSPATRCGVTGLRPTFGRVSRHGAMSLSWSMDKLGPLAHSAEDCALVFRALHGADRKDPTAVDRSFEWPPKKAVSSMKVGFDPALMEADTESRDFHRATLDVLESIGVDLVEWRLPDEIPVDALSFILTAEAAAAFDELTRSGADDELVRQEKFAWPNFFRIGQTVPAVEYLRAQRVRRRLMRQLEDTLGDLDAWVTPPFGGSNLLLTNLTGHPCVVLPNGFRPEGTPTSITFNGRLFGESTLLALAAAYQKKTDFHRRRPPAFTKADGTS